MLQVEYKLVHNYDPSPFKQVASANQELLMQEILQVKATSENSSHCIPVEVNPGSNVTIPVLHTI
jgi:hypothetical protein